MNTQQFIDAEAIVRRAGHGLPACLVAFTSAKDRDSFRDAIEILTECRMFAFAMEDANRSSPAQITKSERRLLQLFKD